MESKYSHLYENQNVVARKLFPDNIKPSFLTGDGVNNFAQYEKEGKLYSSFFNLDRVLMEYEDSEKRILFENGFALIVDNFNYCLSDVNLVMRSTLAELKKIGPINYGSRVVGIASLKNFNIKLIAYQNESSYQNAEQSFDCHLAFYKLYDHKLHNPVMPEYIETVKVFGKVNNIVSLDEQMATYYPKNINEVRVVGPGDNFSKKTSISASNNNSTRGVSFENTGIVLIFHNNWELITYFDCVDRVVIGTQPTHNRDAIFHYFIKSKMYNQIYQMHSFNGSYLDSTNFDNLNQTQNFNISGYFNDYSAIYEQTTEILTVDGYFIRANAKSLGDASRLEVTLNNLVILNDYYVIFYVRALNSLGGPVPFSEISVSIPSVKIPDGNVGIKNNMDSNDLRRYFEPSLGGIIQDSTRADINGAAYLFVKSINADVAEHLQGYWWFTVEATNRPFYVFDEVILQQRNDNSEKTKIDELRKEIKKSYGADLPYMKPHFIQNL